MPASSSHFRGSAQLRLTTVGYTRTIPSMVRKSPGMRTRGRWSASALAVLGIFGTFGVLASTNVATRTPLAGANGDRYQRDGGLHVHPQLLHTPAARSRLRGPAAPPAWHRRPWGRDRGVARTSRVAAGAAAGERPTRGLRRLRSRVPLAGTQSQGGETFPHPAHPWFAFGEEVFDAEVVHAIAPRCPRPPSSWSKEPHWTTRTMPAASVAALRLAASEGGIVSLSPAGQIGGEHCVTHAQVAQLNAALGGRRRRTT